MKRNWTRPLSALLSLVLLLSLMPLAGTARAMEVRSGHGKEIPTLTASETTTLDDAGSGTCGDSLTWSYSGGTLTITGDGGIYSYEYGKAPWFGLLEEVTTLVLEPGVTAVSDMAFAGFPNLSSVSFPEGLVHIGTAAFSGCALTSVRLPASLSYLGSYAFDSNPSLTTIELAPGNSTYAVHNGILYTKAMDVLLFCPEGREVGHVTVPATVTEIEAYAFDGCVKLTGVTLPEGLVTIGDGAFYGTSIGAITLPKSLRTLGSDALAYTDIPDITIPAGLENVYSGFVSGCPKLMNIWVEEGHPRLASADGILYTKDMRTLCAYPSGRSGEAIVPAGVTGIFEWAFAGCNFVDFILLPPSITEVGASAFSNCAKLDTVFFLGDAPYFGFYPFRGTATDACYPESASGWTSKVMDGCGGDITWYTHDFVVPNFTDLQPGAFYGEAVLFASVAGITGGTSATTFSPMDNCSRAQVVTFLWRALGCPAPKSSATHFTDVEPGQFYYDAVLWATEQGITGGISDTEFGTMENVTRGQFVTFLWRYKGKPAPTGQNPFQDLDPGQFYHDAVLWAAEKGITGGISATAFGPETPCTRGQVVTFLYRGL